MVVFTCLHGIVMLSEFDRVGSFFDRERAVVEVVLEIRLELGGEVHVEPEEVHLSRRKFEMLIQNIEDCGII